MLFLLITCISFIFFYKSLLLKPLPHWAYETRLLTFPNYFWKEVISFFHISKLIKKSSSQSGCSFFRISSKMSMKKQTLSSKVVEAIGGGEGEERVLLDLPDLVLESILERLPPDGLCSMACVCSELRDRCRSDLLWERRMKQKWGGVMGQAAYRQWQGYIAAAAAAASTKDSCFLEPSGQQRIRGSLMRSLSHLFWPLSLFRSNFDNNNKWSSSSSLPNDSIMSWYRALETGKLWFPAQVYNRENGHVGFLLSCYDAELCYDSGTDTFQARYPPHGRRAPAVENCVTWDRLRAPPIDTTAHDLHISDCLNELRPGDHIEIQWRRNKEFPYGWWYGVVGHLESCDGNHNSCRCHESDTIVLEFNQYTRGSRWRTTSLNRKDHREEGNEADGFYGGIRKLYSNNEISMWRQLWPAQVLE